MIFLYRLKNQLEWGFFQDDKDNLWRGDSSLEELWSSSSNEREKIRFRIEQGKRAKWCLEVSWVFLGFPSVSHVPSRISDIRRAARAEPSQGDSRSGRHRISEIKSQVGGEIRTVAKRKSLDWFRISTSNLYKSPLCDDVGGVKYIFSWRLQIKATNCD